MIHLRTAVSEEIPVIMSIIQQAKAYLKKQNIDQWQQGYPDLDCIMNDIEQKKGYVVMDDTAVIGYVCIDFDGEPAYEKLNGSWPHKDIPYVVAHRMALSSNCRGKGLASSVFRLIEDMARSKNISSFRVDTDEDNQIMKHLLAKNGFVYCGTIWFDNSIKIAYEKYFGS